MFYKGYTDKKPSNYTLQDDGSAAAVTALTKLFGTQYDHGNIAQTICNFYSFE
jgi:hypothetical protein